MTYIERKKRKRNYDLQHATRISYSATLSRAPGSSPILDTLLRVACDNVAYNMPLFCVYVCFVIAHSFFVVMIAVTVKRHFPSYFCFPLYYTCNVVSIRSPSLVSSHLYNCSFCLIVPLCVNSINVYLRLLVRYTLEDQTQCSRYMYKHMTVLPREVT